MSDTPLTAVSSTKGLDFSLNLSNLIPRNSDAILKVIYSYSYPSNEILSTKYSQELDQLKETFRTYSQFDDNWDLEGSITPHQSSIDNALLFLEKMPSDIPLPNPEPGRDGEVGIYWDNREANTFAEVVFEIDNTYTYVAIIVNEEGDETYYGGEFCSVGDSWPPDLLQVLRHC